jgi:hypothetical protein
MASAGLTRRAFGIGMTVLGASAAVGAAGPRRAAEAGAIDLDVLVVGGGVQGLCVLRELRARGIDGAFLVSRDPLGAGESLHSHGLLMRGYALPPEAPIEVARGLAEAFDGWARDLGDGGVARAGEHPTYVGTADPRLAERWKALGLPFEPLPAPPEALAGGHYARGGRLYRTQERLFVGAEVVAALAGDVARWAGRGELTAIRRSERGDRVVTCEVRSGGQTLRLRPELVVLAAGRDNQRLLGGASRPGDAHVVRHVPMILVRGRELPDVSGFFLDAKLSMAAHPLPGGERGWVVTPLGGHATTRADFDAAREAAVDPALVRDALDRIFALMPRLRPILEERARFGVYFGPKLDHPSGLPLAVIGDAGLANLRHVAPVVFTLARPAAVEVVRQLEATEAWPRLVRARRPLDPRLGALAGVPVGTEERLRPERRWLSLPELRRTLGR